MRMGNDGRPVFLSNNAGGILGGISTGQPVVARFAVKPTSSILTRVRTITRDGRRDRDHRPRAATTPASASAPCRSARPCWRSSSPTTISATAPRRGHRRAPKPEPAAIPDTPRVSDTSESAARVAAAIEAFKRGEIVVVTDDDDRENEGDLIVAAVHCTPEKMAFIIRHTSGIVCAPLPGETARRLRLGADGRRQRRAARHRLHRLRRFPPRPDHRHLRRGARRDRPRARQRQCRRGRFRPPRPRLPADRPRRRRADALRPYRGLRRSLPSRRAAAGRRPRRADERRRHRHARRTGRRLRRRRTTSPRCPSPTSSPGASARERLVERIGEFPGRDPRRPGDRHHLPHAASTRCTIWRSSSATSATARNVTVRLQIEDVAERRLRRAGAARRA